MLTTKLIRLKSISNKLKGVPTRGLKHWCEAKICGCMGCANGSMSQYVRFNSKQEWQDYMLWSEAGKPDTNDIPKSKPSTK